MDNERVADVFQVEIHIGNINSNSQIVLNDLRLLELLHKYPFLFGKALAPQADKDYEEWCWRETGKATMT
ncbi:GH21397 [Drosophila grimshawi]|uniref:GH21397 n=1 Tax=Drosophila grimshawi TaxID=7222 RepID=B4J921_DROGR|nr:GH21397 [Drosophila grimshawi]